LIGTRIHCTWTFQNNPPPNPISDDHEKPQIQTSNFENRVVLTTQKSSTEFSKGGDYPQSGASVSDGQKNDFLPHPGQAFAGSKDIDGTEFCLKNVYLVSDQTATWELNYYLAGQVFLPRVSTLRVSREPLGPHIFCHPQGKYSRAFHDVTRNEYVEGCKGAELAVELIEGESYRSRDWELSVGVGCELEGCCGWECCGCCA